ncbi:protein fantom [Denticeps clupeoides]|uniref:C2 domain-containing protein n=1 Tax=Denticeps clupeoides TaxID=299321 RepID=A0AAY4DNU3_9TELE|nr:protein fantom [Denticeps clupeoides]XP_028813485.1 protein fantom [Denticeps clupeoides]
MSSLADDTAGDTPVRDMTWTLPGARMTPVSLVAQNARERQTVSKMSREELEDRFLRLHEDNLLVKQHNLKHEDKLKRMSTKMIRLGKERKRMEQMSSGVRGATGRNVEMEELVEDLQEKVQHLEKQNEGLKQRLISTKHQLQVKTRRPTPYGHVQPRINTGLRRMRDDVFSPQQPHTPSRASRNVEPDTAGARPPHGLLPRYGHSLLDDARAEIRNLENVVESQRTQMEEMERETDIFRDQLRRKDREYEESLLQLREQQTSGQRSAIKDNVEMIKMHKQLAEKGSNVTVLEGKLLHLQENQKTLNAGHDVLLAKVDELTGQLKEERLKNLGLESQMHSRALEQRRIEELQEQVNDLEKERELLKENCDKLVNSAFDVSQEQKWKTREQQLKLQIAQLEMAVKSELADKNEILDKIKAERDLNESLSQENKQLQLKYLEQKQQLDELKERMKFFIKESETDAAELSEALLLIKLRKTQKNEDLSFLEQVDRDICVDLERSMKELQATHAETVQELEKTRNMLLIQHKINKDYQAEVDVVTQKLDELKMENELKTEKLAHLLDMRAAKIKKLEAQLKDIAYGTKAHVFRPDVTDEGTTDVFDETVQLERGENLLEIHFGAARFSPEALEYLDDSKPSTFCTFAFYDYELQATSVVAGVHPDYNSTSQYLVRVDDLFLHYLNTSTVAMEIQLAQGMDFRTVAAGQLRLKPLLENSGKVFGTLQLMGVIEDVHLFGTLEYWLRLRVPMEQAIRLYKERSKALGYLSSSLRDEHQVLNDIQNSRSLADANLNELHITVQCCSNLKSRDPQHQPCPYVIYKLFDFPDHDTPIMVSTSNPQFEDTMTFPLQVNSDLDRSLRSEFLMFYVFDEKAEDQLYLGKARVPLISLAHDKSIRGTFELVDPVGVSSGHIDVTLKWKFTYLPPPGTALTCEQAKFIPKEKPLNLTTKEEEKETKAPDSAPQPPVSELPLPKPRKKSTMKTGSRKVSFMDSTSQDSAVEQLAAASGSDCKEMPSMKVVEVPKAGLKREEEDGGDEEEEPHFSDGQMIVTSSPSISEDSDISEELPEDRNEQLVGASNPNESILSDSDDCIVPGQSAQSWIQPSDRIRVEIVSLTLRPDSRAAKDPRISRLFVEYTILGLPSVETPLSLLKPLPGQAIYYNYSNTIHVDVEKNQARRQDLRAMLEGRNRQLESIRFTVVSDPPEEEEQELECEDVGVAYLRVTEILEKRRDMTNISLNLVDVLDSSVVVGSLRVTVEALKAFRSIMEDPDHDC